MEIRIILIALALQNGFNWNKIVDDLKKKIYPEPEWIEEAKKTANEYITILDDDYPEKFKISVKPPIVISR